MSPFVLRAALTGFALWVVTHFVHGLQFVGGRTTLERVAIIFVVAVIFGLVNAIIKPIVQFLSIPLYIVTLGLFHIDHFWWTAIWAAVVLSIVSWLLSLVVRDVGRQTRR
jgi:putative membrane protein